MSNLFSAHSPLRIFGVSLLLTLAMLVFVGTTMGTSALVVAAVLVIIETAFSFDNAIINAKILKRLSTFWQNIFLTVGMVIAVFGMRVVFPIVLVMITTKMGWNEVLDLALHHPKEYAHALEQAHPTIAAYGGAFLLMLGLYFFLDDTREVHWLRAFETKLQKLAGPFSAPILAAVIVAIFAVLPFNHHHGSTLTAGLFGILTYLALHAVTLLIEKYQPQVDTGKAIQLTGMAAFTTFIYLEFLDASFSFDGVIGAFAITSDVILIALGLGVGALWVRSLTVFMVRRGTLDQYRYIDHGAHYTVLALAFVLLSSAFLELPEAVTGALGLVFIAASIWDSVRFRRRRRA
jgi:hypothetical protein